MIRRLVVALTALSLALPAIAAAHTDPPYDPGQAAQSGTGQAQPLSSQPAPRAGVSTEQTGFDWGDAGIGAGVTLCLVAVTGGALLAYKRGAAPFRPVTSRS